MKRAIWLLAVLVLATGSLSAAEKSKKKDAKSAAPDPMMAAWMAFSTPGEAHRVLDGMVGNWDHTLRWWMTADAKPETSTGTHTSQWIMGGRFVQQSVSGFSMGQPFQGMGIVGYNNAKKQYESFWIDNMTTAMMTGTGQYDAASKTITEKGICSDPVSGDKPYRGVTKFVGNDDMTFEMFVPGADGKEFRMMEIVYKRKK